MTLRTVAIAMAGLVLGLTLTAALAEQVLVLKNGNRLNGQVTKTADGYELKTARGTITYPADAVAKVEEAVSPREEFQARRAKLADKDAEGRYQLGLWAKDKDLLEESRDVLREALELKPDYENARLLLKLVEMKLTGPVKPPPGVTATITETPAGEGQYLAEADIYRIRLVEFELRPKGSVLVDFRNKVVDRFIKAKQGIGLFENKDGEAKFRALPPIDKVREMIQMTDREEYAIRDDILLKGDPEVIRDFRAHVWPILAKNCAAVACHGAPKGQANYKLFATNVTDDKVLYTNFYTLVTWKKGDLKMIDRDQVENSLLLESGLPRSIAKQSLAHAKAVENVPFASRTDRDFLTVQQWISTLKPLLPPGYRVEYKVGGVAPAAAPAAPATPAKPAK